MRKKICVTASEVLQMRESGMSNRDIASSLDISYSTVVNYIGKQGKRMESLAAFRDTPTKTEKPKTVAPVEYDPKPVTEIYRIGKFAVELDGNNRYVTITDDGGCIIFAYEDIPDLVQFLAWAMRKRMEVNTDADR